METPDATSPDSHASAFIQAPPSAAQSNLPPDATVWAAARASYVAGCSTPVVAERHGLNERTVRRRAAAEDWASLRAGARPSSNLFAAANGPSASLFTPGSGFIHALAGEPIELEAALEADPDLAPFVAAHSFEVGELLMRATPDRLARFAFRRSAESAARGAPGEALAWMRLVQVIDRTHERLERAGRTFSGADHMRAQYAAQLRAVYEGEEEGLGEEGGGAPG